MNQTTPSIMQVAAIDRFGGVETLTLRTMPLPTFGPDEVLLRVETAGLGSWDCDEREGRYAEYLGAPVFPYVLGWDAAGTIVAVGEHVRRFKEHDRVYAATLPKPNGGGFYAQYAAVKVDDVSHIPEGLTVEQAGVMGWDALTALSGVDDTLRLKPGETVMVFGASGGIGHIAIQLAKRMGARVLAVASGEDGVALARRLGADAAVNGRRDDVLAAALEFAPGGVDACLVTAGGATADRALEAVRDGGRIAYPNGVVPAPKARAGLRVDSYDGIRSPAASEQLHRLIASGPFEVHVARSFTLDEIAQAHLALEEHYLGKLALRPDGV